MDAVTKVLEMGGYAMWVWPAYGAVAVGLIGLLLITLRSLKAREREFAAVRRNRPPAPGDAA